MSTPRSRCARCNAFVPSVTPVLVTEPVVRSRAARLYDLAIGGAATVGLVDLAVRGFRVAHAALRSHGVCP